VRFSGDVHGIDIVMYPGELAEAYGGMGGVQSLCAGYVNEHE
jgi:hypothetical protein